MFTVDASVHLNALKPDEVGSAESQALLERLHHDGHGVYAPTLLLVELAGAVVRAIGDADAARAIVEAVSGLPGQQWVILDDLLSEEAAWLAAEYRLRGADAVYGATARHYQTTLVTRDRHQLERLVGVVPTLTPAQAIDLLDQG